MSAKSEAWDNLLREIEKLAVSVKLGHPRGIGLGFDWGQMEIINNIITLGVKTGDFDDRDE